MSAHDGPTVAESCADPAVTEVLAGFTVAVTADKRRDEMASLLEDRGARVVLAPALRLVPLADDGRQHEATLPVYRWAPLIDPTPLHRLVDLITNRLVDAVTFTSAAAVGSVLRAAGPRTEAVLAALRGPVVAGCVGRQAAEPLRRHGVPVLAPARARISALVEALTAELPRRTRTLTVAGAELVLRGHAAVVDGILKPLPPAQMTILRSLAAVPGKVLARSELLGSLPRGADEHAVEMAVARLRAALGGAAFIQTVVKRGYRLRMD
jgi:uroporphyrinogen-III synthase